MVAEIALPLFVEAVGALGLRVRVGLHTGEVETIDGKAGGLAVIIGARVGALAGAGEVLASSTVRDLATGSGLRFDDRGEHELKGIKGAWHLYAAGDHYRKALERAPDDWDLKYNFELVQYVLRQQELDRQKEEARIKSILERIRTITEPGEREPPPPEKRG